MLITMYYEVVMLPCGGREMDPPFCCQTCAGGREVGSRRHGVGSSNRTQVYRVGLAASLCRSADAVLFQTWGNTSKLQTHFIKRLIR